jgi:beta-phosphoglucomutase family hydrolase
MTERLDGLRAVLWDLDGTLVDSEEYHWRAWRETMGREGISITRQDFLATFGQRNDAILPHWLGSGVSSERVQQIGDAKEARYRELVQAEGLAPLPGVVEWVDRLGQEGWRQAVASSAPRRNVEVVLDTLKLAACFDALIAAEDVRKGKPDPEVFLLAASRVGAPAERCVVVEDAAAGIESASRAGMRSIGVGRESALLRANLTALRLSDLPLDAFQKLLEEV